MKTLADWIIGFLADDRPETALTTLRNSSRGEQELVWKNLNSAEKQILQAYGYSFEAEVLKGDTPLPDNIPGETKEFFKFYKMEVLARESRITLLKERPSKGSPKICDTVNSRLLHAIIGVCTEGGEALDVMKKNLFYGKEIDKTNLIEELGDLLWYIQLAADELGTTIPEIIQANIAKLRERYPVEFSEEKALERDLDKERSVLERHSEEGS